MIRSPACHHPVKGIVARKNRPAYLYRVPSVPQNGAKGYVQALSYRYTVPRGLADGFRDGSFLEFQQRKHQHG